LEDIDARSHRGCRRVERKWKQGDFGKEGGSIFRQQELAVSLRKL